MKKYNKPEIVTLALDVVDVIETSGGSAVAVSANYAETVYSTASLQSIDKNITEMTDTWSW